MHTEDEWTVATSRIDLLSRILDADKRHEGMYGALRDLTLTGLAAQKENAVVALVPVKEALVQARAENDKRFDDLRKEADSRDRAMSDKLDALTLIVTAARASSESALTAQQSTTSKSQWNVTTTISALALVVSSGVALFIALHG